MVDRASRVAIWAVMLAVVLVYFGPFWWPGDGSGWVTLVRLSVFMSAVLVVLAMYQEPAYWHAFWRRPMVRMALLLFAYLIFNALVLQVDGKAFRRLLLLALFLFAFGFFRWSDMQVRRFAMLLASAGCLFAAYSLVSHGWQDTLPKAYRQGGMIDSGRAGVAEFGNTIVAAMHFAVSFVLLIYLFLTETSKRMAGLWLAMLGVVAAYIVLTFARAGWIACLVGSAVLYVQTFRRTSRRHWFLMALFGALLLYFLVNFFHYEFYERGLTNRDEIWKTVLIRMEGYWYLGYGVMAPFDPIGFLNGRVFVHNSHNVYLEILYQTGIFGLLLYVALLATAVRTLFQTVRLNPEHAQGAGLALAMLVAVSVVMATELNSWLHTPNLMWQWLWVPVAYAMGISAPVSKNQLAARS